jgi:hypothetical protein
MAQNVSKAAAWTPRSCVRHGDPGKGLSMTGIKVLWHTTMSVDGFVSGRPDSDEALAVEGLGAAGLAWGESAS